MKLKGVFRFQNRLQSLLDEVQKILDYQTLLTEESIGK